MKVLRLLRNIAALFILVMGLLASRPGVGAPKQTGDLRGQSCGLKPGYTNCSVDKNGKCHDSVCRVGSKGCLGDGCVF